MLKLYEHQTKILNILKSKTRYALFCEVGVGKTAILVALIRWLYESRGSMPKTLVVCPKSVMTNWCDEFWRFGELYAEVVTGIKRKKELILADDICNIKIINPESLKTMYAQIKEFNPEILIVDESHWFKSPNAIRTKTLMKLAEQVPLRYLLSGTPITNSYEDIWSQFNIMDGGETFGTNFWGHFKHKYFADANAGWKHQKNHFSDWQPKPGAAKEILDKMASLSVSLKKIDCLDLPPQIYQTKNIEMTLEQRRVYTSMATEFIAYVKGETEPAVATNALTKLLRLMQVTSGFVKTEDGKEVTMPGNRKVKAVLDDLKDLCPNHKVVVWSNFIHSCNDIYSGMGKFNPKRLYGGVNELEEFKSDDLSRELIANPASGGTGVNITCASYNIYLSNSFNLAHRIQSEGRTHRLGSDQHEKIVYTDYLMVDSIDAVIYEALRNKRKIADLVLNLKKEDFGI